MNNTTLLNHGLNLGTQIAFLIPNPFLAGGIVTALMVSEMLVNDGGENPTATAIRESGRAIVDHINGLAKEFPNMLLQAQQQLFDAQIQSAADWLLDIDHTLNPPGDKPMENIPEDMFNAWMSQVNTLTGPDSNLRIVGNYARQNIGDKYVTLALSLTADLVYLNCCRYMADLDFRFACQQYLAAMEAPAAGRPKPPVPKHNSGPRSLVLNTTIHERLKATLDFAVPRVQAINRAVIARQIAADQAAAAVQVVWDATLLGHRLQPTVPAKILYEPAPIPVPVSAEHYQGYGMIGAANLNTLALFPRAQARADAWNKATTEGHLDLLSLENILQLNHTLCLLHTALGEYCKLLGHSEPAPLAGVYPAALPDVPTTDPGSPKPPPAPTPEQLREAEKEIERRKAEQLHLLKEKDPVAYEIRKKSGGRIVLANPDSYT
jgi:hypothetical protein